MAYILVGMVSAPKRHTRDRLVDAAFREVHRTGFQSADLDAILSATGVTKGALYYYFPSKEALGHAVVEEAIARLMHEKWTVPLEAPGNPIDILIRIVQGSSLKPEDIERGCPLNNLAQEMSPLDTAFRKKLAKVLTEWRGAIAKALRQGQQSGAVRHDIDPEDSATLLMATYEGYISLAKSAQDAKVLRSGIKHMTRYLESLRPL